MHHLAACVRQHLHLDMPRPLDRFFKEQRTIAERRLSLAAAPGEGFRHFAIASDQTHPAPAATGRGFQHHGIAQGRSDLHRDLGGPERALTAWNGRHTCRFGQFPRRHLVAKQRQRLRARADESQSGRLASKGKGGTLGEETISGVHTVAAAFDSHCHQRPDIQVSRDRIAAGNADRAGFGRDARMQT